LISLSLKRLSLYFVFNAAVTLFCLVVYLISDILGKGSELVILGLFSILNIFVFGYILNRNDLSKLITDIGFILLAFFLLYTIIPIIVFITDAYRFTFLGWLDLTNSSMVDNTYRHIIFSLSIQVVYIFFYRVCSGSLLVVSYKPETFVFLLCILLYLLVLVALSLFSNPVENYYDHYTRFDHLDGLSRKVVSIIVRVYNGLLPFLIMFSVFKYKDNKWCLFPIIFGICAYDVFMSHGSRIQALFVIIQAMIFYSYICKPIATKNVLFVSLFVVLIFTGIEIFRLATSDFSDVIADSYALAGEFSTLFYPEIYLFELRESGSMPTFDLGLYFKDFFELIPFLNIPGVNPMTWFWENFHPEAPVAPFTLGPISDSAMFGGNYSIPVRGALLGLVLGAIKTMFERNANWISLSIYSYLCSVVVLSLKYGFLTPISLLIKNWMIGFILIVMLFGIKHIFNRNSALNTRGH